MERLRAATTVLSACYTQSRPLCNQRYRSWPGFILHQLQGRRIRCFSVNKKNAPITLFISCHPGLENVLTEETQRIIAPVETVRHGVRVRASSNDTLRCCLCLGSATQVYIQLACFTARGWPELERKVKRYLPNDIFVNSHSLLVKARSRKSKLYHTEGIRTRVETILQRDHGTTKSTDTDTAPACLHVHVAHDQVQLLLAAYSTPLHRRQYRLLTAKAPLREDLAYAMLWDAGLVDSSAENENPFDVVFDPFCGAGTIAIEAAMVRDGLSPGRNRSAPFDGTKYCHPELWANMISTDHPRKKMFDVMASDRDKGAIDAARTNAQRAGVDVDLSITSFSAHPFWNATHTHPLIVSNLPFGKRTVMKSKETRLPTALPMYQKLCTLLETVDVKDSLLAALLTNDTRLFPQRTTLNTVKSSLSFNLGPIRTNVATMERQDGASAKAKAETQL